MTGPADKSVYNSNLYLSAIEAADMLGVAVTSLYAYVGRKGIRSVAQPGTRKRLYWREDVERMAQTRAGASVVRSESLLVPQTKITLLTEEGPYYRGQSAVALAETASLEDIGAILWDQPKEAVFPNEPPAMPPDLPDTRMRLKNLSRRDQCASLFSLIERSHPRNYNRSALGFARAGGELVRWYAAFVTGRETPSAEPVHRILAQGWNVPKPYEDVIRRTLVLLADHELTADTYAVRALANTGCTPHQAVVTGMIATEGHWMRQGQVALIRRLIREIINEPDPVHPLVGLYREGISLPGFEDRSETPVDARAGALLNAIATQLCDMREVRKLLRAVRIARDDFGVEPSFPLVILFLEEALRLSPDYGSLKVAGRMVGWIAHAYEQMQTGHVVRLHSAYTGVLPLDPTSPAGSAGLK